MAIELKTGKFLPEYVGKMQFYLTALDETVKEKKKTRLSALFCAAIKHARLWSMLLRQSRKPIGVAKYQIVSKLPAALRKELPAPEQIAKTHG